MKSITSISNLIMFLSVTVLSVCLLLILPILSRCDQPKLSFSNYNKVMKDNIYNYHNDFDLANHKTFIKFRSKRMPYQLPDGAKEINLGKEFKRNFKCQKDKDGFFADIDNNCKVFHRCHTAYNAGGRIEVMHFSFVCAQDLVFDQSIFSCTRKDDAIPCDASPMFYDLNERLGSDGPFLTDADVERAKSARPQY